MSQPPDAPFQHALGTSAGCECIAHVLQGITDLDSRATVTSIDGTSAYDLISPSAMMQGIQKVHGAAVVFVPSTHLWEDEKGTPCTGRSAGPIASWLILVRVFGRHICLQYAGKRWYCVHVAPERALASRRNPHSPGQDQDLESRWEKHALCYVWSAWLASQT